MDALKDVWMGETGNDFFNKTAIASKFLICAVASAALCKRVFPRNSSLPATMSFVPMAPTLRVASIAVASRMLDVELPKDVEDKLKAPLNFQENYGLFSIFSGLSAGAMVISIVRLKAQSWLGRINSVVSLLSLLGAMGINYMFCDEEY